jgi:hypothetical protein
VTEHPFILLNLKRYRKSARDVPTLAIFFYYGRRTEVYNTMRIKVRKRGNGDGDAQAE